MYQSSEYNDNRRVDLSNNKKTVETNYMISYDKNLRPQRVQEKSIERYVRENRNQDRNFNQSFNKNQNQNNLNFKLGAQQPLPKKKVQGFNSNTKTNQNSKKSELNIISSLNSFSKEKMKSNLNNARFQFKNKNIKNNTSSNTFGDRNNMQSESFGSGLRNPYSNTNQLVSSTNSQNIYNYQNQSLQNSQDILPSYNNNITGQFNPYSNSSEDFIHKYNEKPSSSYNQFYNTAFPGSQMQYLNQIQQHTNYPNQNPYNQSINPQQSKYDYNQNKVNNNDENYNNFYRNQMSQVNHYRDIENDPKNLNENQPINEEVFENKSNKKEIETIKELHDSNQNPDESGNSLSSFTPSERTKEFFKREVLNNDKLKNSMNNYYDYNSSYKNNMMNKITNEEEIEKQNSHISNTMNNQK